MSDTEFEYGLGVRFNRATGRVDYLFEGANLAEDEDGNPHPALVAIKTEFTDPSKVTLERVEAIARDIKKAGLPEYHLKGEDLTLLTREQYEAYEEDDR
jgi:hypothetical protein